ncbi:MAG: hypothetical protein LBM16_03860 [Clostridiales bacterium]|jgi:hypothetical protein|nr:hypothetical protein [Clostridiales bacterium]
MNQRRNQILFGLLILALGVFGFVGKSYTNTFSRFLNFAALGAGMAMIWLYFNKRKTWALIIGVIITHFSVSNIISNLVGNFFNIDSIGAAFFIITGVIFFIISVSAYNEKILLPGCILIFIGLVVEFRFAPIIKNIDGLPIIAFGLSFIASCLFSKLRFGSFNRNQIFLGSIFIILGVISALNLSISAYKIFALTIVFIGCYIIFKAFRKR